MDIPDFSPSCFSPFSRLGITGGGGGGGGGPTGAEAALWSTLRPPNSLHPSSEELPTSLALDTPDSAELDTGWTGWLFFWFEDFDCDFSDDFWDLDP